MIIGKTTTAVVVKYYLKEREYVQLIGDVLSHLIQTDSHKTDV